MSLRKILGGAVVAAVLVSLTVEASAEAKAETEPLIRIAVAGNVSVPDKDDVAVGTIQLDKVAKTEADGIWIFEDDIAAYTSAKGIAYLRELLHNGKVIAFVTDESPNDVLKAFGLPRTTVTGNDRQVGFYLWENLAGKLYTGYVYTVGNASVEAGYDALLEQTINHMGHVNRNYPNGFPSISTMDYSDDSGDWDTVNEVERNWLYNRGNTYTEISVYYKIPDALDDNPDYGYYLTEIVSEMDPASVWA